MCLSISLLRRKVLTAESIQMKLGTRFAHAALKQDKGTYRTPFKKIALFQLPKAHKYTCIVTQQTSLQTRRIAVPCDYKSDGKESAYMCLRIHMCTIKLEIIWAFYVTLLLLYSLGPQIIPLDKSFYQTPESSCQTSKNQIKWIQYNADVW